MGTQGHRRPTALGTKALRRWLAVLAVLALAFTACGGDNDASDDAASDDPATDEAPSDSDGGDDADSDENGDTDDAATDGDDPVVRLVSVTYQGNPAYEFTYEDDGTPVGYTLFHPVTGEPRSENTAVAFDDAGNITEFAIENLEEGTTATETATYDDQGRVTSQHYVSDTTDWTTTYTYDASTVVVTAESGTLTYTLDDDGNIATSVSNFSDRETTITNLAFDDVPEPRTMTGGLLVQIYSTNNATRWTPDAGCEYVEDFTYENDLLVASHADGCGFTHDYTYTYAEF